MSLTAPLASRSTSSSAGSFFVVSGTLPLQSQSYVSRQADKDLFTALLAGEYCFVLNSRQMGKSSLSVRTMAKLQEAGVQTVFLDLTKIGGSNVTPEQWYIGLLSETGRALGLRKEFLTYWKENAEYSLVQRYLGALHDVALASTESRIVLFVDEIDAVKSLSFSTDEFFAAVRECYNRRVHEPEYDRLAFALVGSATASDLIKDTRTSPFNIGKRIELKDFTLEEALPLAEGIARPKANSLVERAFYWTSGHPFLTQALCAEIAQDSSVQTPAGVDRLVEQMFFEAKARERNVNLADVSNRILSSYLDPEHKEEHRAAILDLYSNVRSRRHKVVDDETNHLVAILKLSGITTSANGELHVRNRIYAHIFDWQWIRDSMPDAELRRQQQAYKAGMLRTSAVAACVVLVMALLVGVALSEREQAQRSAKTAREKENAARRSAGTEHLALQRADKNAAQLEVALLKVKDALRVVDAAKTEASNNAKRAQNQQQRADRKAQEAQSAALREKRQHHLADIARNKEAFATIAAKRQAEYASHLRYEAILGQIQLEWENNNVAKVRELLGEARNLPYRGIEWDYWNNRARAAQRQTTRDLAGHNGQIWGMAISPDGKWIASVSHDSTVRLWNVRTGVSDPPIGGFVSPPYGVAFSPDSNYIATIDGSELRLWKVHATRPSLIMPALNTYVSVAFSPDGALVAATGTAGIQIWNAQTGVPQRTLTGHKGNTWRVAFTPDGHRIVSTGFDGMVKIWDVQTGALLYNLKGHTDYVTALAISPDGKQIVTGSRDSEIIVWDAESGSKLQSFKAHKGEITSAAFSPDGTRLATGSRDASAQLWDAKTWQPSGSPLIGHKSDVRVVAFTPDGMKLVTASSDNTLKVWDVNTNNDVLVLHADLAQPTLSFPSFDGTYFPITGAGSSEDWSILTGQSLGICPHPPVPLQYSPDGKRVALARGNFIAVWDTAGNKRRFTRVCPVAAPVVFSADSRQLLVAEHGGAVHWFNALSGKEDKTAAPLPAHELLMALSPDGRHCLTRDPGKGAILTAREIGTGKKICSLTGHSGFITAAVYTPDGKRIVTAGYDRTAKIWDAETGHELATLKGHTSDLTQVAVSANGKQIATSAIDNTVRVWLAASHPDAKPLPGEREQAKADMERADRLVRDIEQQGNKLLGSFEGRGPSPPGRVGILLFPFPPQREASLRSLTGSVITFIHFYNDTEAPRKLFWIGFEGKRQFFHTIPPHADYLQSTYSSHVWLVTDMQDRSLMLYVAMEPVGVANIEPVLGNAQTRH